MFPLAAAQVPGPQACVQALLTSSVAQKTLVPLPKERERAFSKVHAQEHHIPVIALDRLKFSVVLAEVRRCPLLKGLTSAT